jgi:hypothetical protein
LRAEYIEGVFDAVEKGIYEANKIGKRYYFHLAMLVQDDI